MAGCDYEDCVQCGRRKVVYSANMDWPDGVEVLCADCAKARPDLTQAAVAAALEGAAEAVRKRGQIAIAQERPPLGAVTQAFYESYEIIRALITAPQRDALQAVIEKAVEKATRTVTVKHDGQEVGDLPYLTEERVIDADIFRAALAALVQP